MNRSRLCLCDSQATSKMPSWHSLCAFCLNESHESNAQSHRISWRKYSIYPLCGQGLSSPPLSPEFCMQAGAAMWKRGLKDEGKGVGGGMGYPCPHPLPYPSLPCLSVYSLFSSLLLSVLHLFSISVYCLQEIHTSMSFPSCPNSACINLLSCHVLITSDIIKALELAAIMLKLPCMYTHLSRDHDHNHYICATERSINCRVGFNPCN